MRWISFHIGEQKFILLFLIEQVPRFELAQFALRLVIIEGVDILGDVHVVRLGLFWERGKAPR